MRERIAGVLSERVRLGISPHAPYTCTVDLYRASAALGLPVATHLAESDAETEFLRTGSGSWRDFAELRPAARNDGIRMLAEAGSSGRTSSQRTAYRRMRRRSASSLRTTSLSRTVRARTRCSAAG